MLSRPKSHGVGYSDWAPAARASAESHAAYESDGINMYQGMRLVCDRVKKAPADRDGCPSGLFKRRAEENIDLITHAFCDLLLY